MSASGDTATLNAITLLLELPDGVTGWERIKQLKAAEESLRRGRELVEAMDRMMPEGAAEDEDGWIVNYRIPVGPWHRLLGWARGASSENGGTE